jgi:hypothetical protein
MHSDNISEDIKKSLNGQMLVTQWGKEEKITKDPSASIWDPVKAKMTLAYWVLGGIISVLILAIISNALSTFNIIDKTISPMLLEIWKTGLLPIVTLILGYYFSKQD